MEIAREWIESVALVIEALAVALMAGFILVGTVKWLWAFSRRDVDASFHRYRVLLGKMLLVGLELLVAADIIRTVILDTTLANIAALGVLVLVRTFLSWTLTLEVEGRWPWQAPKQAGPGSAERPRQERGLTVGTGSKPGEPAAV